MLFYKHLKSCSVPEDTFLEEINSVGDKVWFTAKNTGGYELDFVKDKPNAGFYLARLKKFPNLCRFIEETFPNVIVANSYVTKCLPHYAMEKHIDANRQTAVIMPLGENKGLINYYIKDIKVSTCKYKGPTLSRVDVIHSAVNNSDQTRYSVTIELTGSYFSNFFKYH